MSRISFKIPPVEVHNQTDLDVGVLGVNVLDVNDYVYIEGTASNDTPDKEYRKISAKASGDALTLLYALVTESSPNARIRVIERTV